MSKVVARTRLNVTSYVNCLSCLFCVFSIFFSTTMFYFPLFLIRLMQFFLRFLFSFFALKCLIFLLRVHFFSALIMFPHEHISLYHFSSLHSLTHSLTHTHTHTHTQTHTHTHTHTHFTSKQVS